jgi:hypothetical protein
MPAGTRDGASGGQSLPDVAAGPDAATTSAADVRLADAAGGDGAGADAEDDRAPFVGAWQYISGNRMVYCPTVGMNTTQLTGRVNLERGAGVLLGSLMDPPCVLQFDVSGQAARARAGQICPPQTGKFNDGTPYTETDSFNDATFVVLGGRATFSAAGSGQVVAAGMTFVCTFTFSGTLERAMGPVKPAIDAGTAPDAPPPPNGYRLTGGRYRVTGYTAGSDGCEIHPGSVAQAMADLPVEVDAAGTMGVGNPKGIPPVPSLGRGTLDRKPGAMTRLVRQNQVMGEGGTCAYGSDVISLVTLDADDAFSLGVVERQSNRRGCPVPAGIGPECTSFWTWRMTRIP